MAESDLGAGRACTQRNRNGRESPRQLRGLLLKDLVTPDFRDYAVQVVMEPECGEATRELGKFRAARDAIKQRGKKLSRVADETASNRLDAIYEATDKIRRSRCCPRTGAYFPAKGASWKC